MDLSTNFLGLKLPHPLVAGASPLATDLDAVRRLEDAGAAAIVMHSVFQEQIERETTGTILDVESSRALSPEALSFFPDPDEFRLGLGQYLEQIRKVKEAVKIPVVASVNAINASGWIEYTQQVAQAGADAIELNLYYIGSRPGESSGAVELRMLEVLGKVKAATRLPVAVKLSPFFSSLSHFASALDKAGAAGLVLFNRFYQPDIDVERLEVVPTLHLSDSSELLLRLRWVAMLAGTLKASLIVTGGVHEPVDVVKAVMCGADAVQVVSALYKHGPGYLGTLRKGFAAWVERHEYDSLAQLKGSMSLRRSPDPQAFERANYMRVLSSWRPGRVET